MGLWADCRLGYCRLNDTRVYQRNIWYVGLPQKQLDLLPANRLV